MKINKYIYSLALATAGFGFASCSEIEHGTTDIDSWGDTFEKFEPQTYTLNHPCMLHSQEDLDYVKAHLGQKPWSDGYQKLKTSGFCNETYKASPVKYLARLDAGNWGDGGGRWDDAGLRDEYYPGIHNNYTQFFRDCHAAYQLALEYQLTGNLQAAATAVKIIEDWAAVNRGILLGRDKWKDDVIDSNEYLIMFQIHQIANAAELLRDYNGWGESEQFNNVCVWLKTYFAPFCSKFIATNAANQHWWLNWDLASMTALLSIGILTDDQDMINEAILAYKMGAGPGCMLRGSVVEVFDDPSGTGEKLAQGQESGRDQGHNTLTGVLAGYFCQMAYNIGDDLFALGDNRAIAFAQYICKYNLVKPEVGTDYKVEVVSLSDANFKYPESSMPFKPYKWGDMQMDKISADGRGTIRPGWDLWYGYCVKKGIKATYIKEMAEHFRADGGGGHYGPNSGGFDQLGFSTLMYYRE